MLYSLATVTFAILGLFLWHWKRSRRSIAYLPGPPSTSWLVGNIPSFERTEDIAAAHLEWTRKYGTAFCVKGCFGENVLYLSDPKAMQYILNRSGYNFTKTQEIRVRTALVAGRGLISVDGTEHARHRRIMNPSFSYSALKRFLPLLSELSRRTTVTWKAMIRKQDLQKSVLDIWPLLASTTLDAIGEAAFGYKFNSIEAIGPTGRTELHKAYQNLFVETSYMISNFEIMYRRLLGHAPSWVVKILTLLPKKDLRRLNNYRCIVGNVAKDLVEKQKLAYTNSKESGTDIMSILLRANNAEDPKRRLDEDEILSQIMTLLLAGHETTANSLSWILYELSRHPDVQHKLREEVRITLSNVASRGESEITIPDLECMKYTVAVIKETLRYHPIVAHIFRCAGGNDVIPLGTPQHTLTGEMTTAIPVHKGQVVQLGFASYNRLKRVWGEDADEWRPERFLEDSPNEQKTNLGVIGNLSTFSSGLRNCIGWRFAMMEMQAILTDLIDNFEFSPAPNVEIKRAACGLMQSMVKGQENKGVQLPLTVSLVLKDHAD